TMAAGEACHRPLQTQRYELDGPRPHAGHSYTWSRFKLPVGSHGAALCWLPGTSVLSPLERKQEIKKPANPLTKRSFVCYYSSSDRRSVNGNGEENDDRSNREARTARQDKC